MCFSSDPKDTAESTIDTVGSLEERLKLRTKNTHILKVSNDTNYEHDKAIEYLYTLAEHVKGNPSHPTIDQLLRFYYDRKYFLSAGNPSNNDEARTETFFKGVVYRENESSFKWNMLRSLFKDYSANDIKKCFQMSILEYLNLTMYEKELYDEFAKEWAKELAEAAQAAQKNGEMDARVKFKQQQLKDKSLSGLNLDSDGIEEAF